MSSPHLCDVYDVADLMDVRISTVRAIIVDGSRILPEPLTTSMSTGRLVAFWPTAVIQCWLKQGMPSGFEYDKTEFSELVAEQIEREQSSV